jgi:hypothetical protein
MIPLLDSNGGQGQLWNCLQGKKWMAYLLANSFSCGDRDDSISLFCANVQSGLALYTSTRNLEASPGLLLLKTIILVRRSSAKSRQTSFSVHISNHSVNPSILDLVYCAFCTPENSRFLLRSYRTTCHHIDWENLQRLSLWMHHDCEWPGLSLWMLTS